MSSSSEVDGVRGGFTRATGIILIDTNHLRDCQQNIAPNLLFSVLCRDFHFVLRINANRT